MRIAGISRSVQAGRGGFTLLEIAVVLAIIGSLIGALFTIAYLAEYRISMNSASDELSEIVGNMRSLYAGRGIAGVSAICPSLSTATTTSFVQAGIFPTEMVSTGCTAGSACYVNTPWNAGSTADTVNVNACGSSPVQIVVEYNGLDPEACADLLVHNSLPGRNSGLTQIVVGAAPAISGTNLPVTPTAAAAICLDPGGPYTIDWYYKLNN